MPKKQDGDAPDTRPPCGAKKKRGAGICESRILGPKGRCRVHGGFAGGPPKENKNAVTTGEYESILLKSLSADELTLFDHASKRAKLDVINDQIALATVREARMLDRIAKLKASAMTVVEEVAETLTAEEAKPAGEREFSDKWASEMPVDHPETRAAAKAGEPAGVVVKTKTKKQGTLGQIQDLEAALTNVQGLIAKLVDQKLKIENPAAGVTPPGPGQGEVTHGSLDDAKRAASLAALLDRSRAQAGGQAPGADP